MANSSADSLDVIRHRVPPHRRHFVTRNDVRYVVSRLPAETTSRLRKVHLNDRSRGGRVFGYTTARGRREITLCAQPHRMSIRPSPTTDPREFGALAGTQWPPSAIRRFMLYDVLLHEIGHLQVIDPGATSPRRKYADEKLAQEFADEWRGKLWSEPSGHSDPVHDKPSEYELRGVEEGWAESHRLAKKGLELKERRDPRALEKFLESAQLYPHPESLLRLAWSALRFDVEDDWLARLPVPAEASADRYACSRALAEASIRGDRMQYEAFLVLALALDGQNLHDAAIDRFEHALELEGPGDVTRTVYAQVLAARGDLDTAERVFGAALGRKRANPEVVRRYCEFLLDYGEEGDTRRTERALRLLREAARKMPDNPRVWWNLGWAAHLVDGASEEALSALERCLALHPDHSGARQLLERLASR